MHHPLDSYVEILAPAFSHWDLICRTPSCRWPKESEVLARSPPIETKNLIPKETHQLDSQSWDHPQEHGKILRNMQRRERKPEIGIIGFLKGSESGLEYFPAEKCPRVSLRKLPEALAMFILTLLQGVPKIQRWKHVPKRIPSAQDQSNTRADKEFARKWSLQVKIPNGTRCEHSPWNVKPVPAVH